MHKKPFHSDSGKKSYGSKDAKSFGKTSFGSGDKPYKKKFDKEDKPFKKSGGSDEDRPYKKSFGGGSSEDRPFKKSFGGSSEDRPFKKSFDNKGGDRPYKRTFGAGSSEDRPFKKSFDKDGDRPFKKNFGGSEDRPFKKSFDKDGDRPFKKNFGGSEDRPFKKSFDKDGDRPFKKNFGGSEDRPFKKSFDKDGDRPFKKNFGGGEDRPFKKSFDKDGDRPFKKSFGDKGDRPYKKPFEKDGDRPFKKSYDDKGGKPFKKKHGAEDELEEKRPNRYANAFGRLDDDELAASQKKQKERQEQKEQEDEVTFSKELDNKWDIPPVEKDFGKSDVAYTGYKKSVDEEGKPRHRHDASSRFKKQFDNENPNQKAYAAVSEGKQEEQKIESLDGQLMPLNKYIAHCDVCSRRDAVTLIKEGKVTVNGELVTEPGHKVTIEDTITLNDKVLVVQKNLVYILMNKPKGFITTTDDPKGRRTVMELVQNHIEERLFPVGRLDRNTTGLLLLTNDGELTQKLSHPKHEIKKVYKATLDKDLTKADFEKILNGVELEDGVAPVDQLEYLDSKNEIGLEIHSGKNRIVRRIFESLGYEVEKLDRVMYAGLTKKNILRGTWRFLTKQEVINLKHIH